MARVAPWWGGLALDLSAADFSDLGDSRVRSATETRIKVVLHGDETIIRGHFDFNKKGHLSGGEVTSIEFGFGQYDGFKITDLSIGLKALSKASGSASLGDDAKLAEKMLSGNDTIVGGTENDVLAGSAGNDILHGGQGRDDLYGGSGADLFHYSGMNDSFDFLPYGVDKIHDFSQADGDKIDLRDLGNFDFADLTITQKTGETMVEIPAMPGYTMTIDLAGNITLTEADFLL